MSDIYFKCECGKSLAVDEAGIGRTVLCVDCGEPVLVPEPELEFACEGCGAALLAPLSISGDRIKCASCGHRLAVPSFVCSSGGGAIPRSRERAVFRGFGESAPSSPRPSSGTELQTGAAEPPFSPWRALRPQRRSEEPSAVNAPLASDASRVMNDFMRRRMEFRLLRKPAPEPLYSRRVFVVALATAALVVEVVLVRSPAKKKSDQDALPPQAVIFEVDSQIEAEQPAAVPIILTSSENRAVETGPGSETIAALERPTAQSKHQTPETVLSAARDQFHHEPAPIGLPSVMAKDEETMPTELMANASGAATSSDLDAERAMPLRNKVLALEGLIGKDPQQFRKDLPLLWNEILEYTAAHSGVALDKDYWNPAFQTTADWMLGDDSLTYERSLDLVNRALAVLRNAQSANRGAPVQLAMMMAVIHTSRWMSGHVLENAEMIDELWEWARSLDDSALRRACFCQTYSFEGNLLISRFEVPEDVREEFIRERERKLWEFLDDEALSLNDRTDALSHWALAMHNAGRSDEAARALAVWQHRHGEQIVPARYYHVLMQVALFGLGDWELADRALSDAGGHAHQWRTSFDHWSFGEMCRLYYRNIHCNGYETVRTGRKLLKEREERSVKMASGRNS